MRFILVCIVQLIQAGLIIYLLHEVNNLYHYISDLFEIVDLQHGSFRRMIGKIEGIERMLKHDKKR